MVHIFRTRLPCCSTMRAYRIRVGNDSEMVFVRLPILDRLCFGQAFEKFLFSSCIIFVSFHLLKNLNLR